MNALEKVSEVLRRELPNAAMKVDEPDNKDGAWWLDVRDDDQHVIVEWRPRRWFGISVEREDSYGEQSDERYDTAEQTISRVVQLIRSRTKTRPVREMLLQDIRSHRSISQETLAQMLRIKQASVSKTERRPDVLLSTLRRWITALGGELEVHAKFPEETLIVSAPGDVDALDERGRYIQARAQPSQAKERAATYRPAKPPVSTSVAKTRAARTGRGRAPDASVKANRRTRRR